MNTNEMLHTMAKVSPEFLAGAVEYAYQVGHISDAEYRTWNARIIEAERQKTAQLLKMVA